MQQILITITHEASNDYPTFHLINIGLDGKILGHQILTKESGWENSYECFECSIQKREIRCTDFRKERATDEKGEYLQTWNYYCTQLKMSISPNGTIKQLNP